MRNLNKLGVIFGTGAMSALIFSVAACGEDPAPAPTGGTGGGTAGTPAAGTGGNKAGSSGSGGSASGSGGAAAGMSGSGGAKAGAGGGGAGGGGAGGAAGGGAGGGGAGGGGGAPSAACKMLCEGPNSIVMVCAGEAAIDANLKMTPSCLTRCGKETDMAEVKCWQDHTNNFKVMQGDHCKHAGGEMLCAEWPAL